MKRLIRSSLLHAFLNFLLIPLLLSITEITTSAQEPTTETTEARFSVVFDSPVPSGEIAVEHGKLNTLSVANGEVRGNGFRNTERIEVSVVEAHLDLGAFATRISLRIPDRSFTFFLRDLMTGKEALIIPDLGSAVVKSADQRSYADLKKIVGSDGLQAEWQRIEAEPEASYETATQSVRDQICPTWLGLSRDVRLFRVLHDPQLGLFGRIEPALLGQLRGPGCQFIVGRGASAEVDIVRRLDDGDLPILHATQRDKGVEYQMTAFATRETAPLTTETLRGTDWIAAFAISNGGMKTQAETDKYEQKLRHSEIEAPEEEVVCRIRVRAVNTDPVPRYAFFKAGTTKGASHDGLTGATIVDSDQVFCLSQIEGKPMPQSEMAILLPPSDSVVFDLILPHQPISRVRASALASQDYETHLSACRQFWKAKLASAAQISLPEAGIEERVRAGILHLDLITLGQVKKGPLLAHVGVYSPIGSESSPIIQFFDSVGWHEIAERCLDFFFLRQQENGFIQTFGGYQLETGPVLWTAGEHFRYTRDEVWARRVEPNLKKASYYLLDWRKRNQREELRGKGYGLLDGKVADPPDFYHSFMLNAFSYLGLKRVSEMYSSIDPEFSRQLATECDAFLKDLRTAWLENVANSPIVPLGDGSWVPSFGPWSESPGPVSLYAEGGSWYTHGAFASRDSLIGSLYLLPGEVLDPHERSADWLLRSHQELMTVRNAGLSQPYYVRHDWAHLKRGEVKAYLAAYYTQLAALQDRQTYTFWEHYYGLSQHKTHEEGWFLMQSRWMLWDEDWENQTLRLLSMIPRRWMEPGQKIDLKKCASYFGPFDLEVSASKREIRARVYCAGAKAPKAVRIRLPHPQGIRPVKVEGGDYDETSESVTIPDFSGNAEVRLKF